MAAVAKGEGEGAAVARDSGQRKLTSVLIELGNGDAATQEAVATVLLPELRKLAAAFLRRESPGHTLQPSALANEAYLRLLDQRNVGWKNRRHFRAVAARLIRTILVDHARRRMRKKRGSGARRVTLHDEMALTEAIGVDVIALDDALEALARAHSRPARVVELRFFAGLTEDEVADVIGVSRRTVVDDWTLARAWLHRRLGERDAEAHG